jgi:hypothetical protein
MRLIVSKPKSGRESHIYAPDLDMLSLCKRAPYTNPVGDEDLSLTTCRYCKRALDILGGPPIPETPIVKKKTRSGTKRSPSSSLSKIRLLKKWDKSKKASKRKTSMRAGRTATNRKKAGQKS